VTDYRPVVNSNASTVIFERTISGPRNFILWISPTKARSRAGTPNMPNFIPTAQNWWLPSSRNSAAPTAGSLSSMFWHLWA